MEGLKEDKKGFIGKILVYKNWLELIMVMREEKPKKLLFNRDTTYRFISKFP